MQHVITYLRMIPLVYRDCRKEKEGVPMSIIWAILFAFVYPFAGKERRESARMYFAFEL